MHKRAVSAEGSKTDSTRMVNIRDTDNCTAEGESDMFCGEDDGVIFHVDERIPWVPTGQGGKREKWANCLRQYKKRGGQAERFQRQEDNLMKDHYHRQHP